MIITCDGPAASGKSTIGKLVAQRLGIAFLSSGWFYRALAYLLLTHENYTLENLINADEGHIAYYLDPLLLKYEYSELNPALYFKGENITPYLKDFIIDRGSILLSPRKFARDQIMHLQRVFVSHSSCVVEGRDCGSVVFPDADYKFYITASLTVRSARWNEDQKRRGTIFTQQEAEKQLYDRDERDKKREYGALIIPDGAHIIDTTHLTLAESVDSICYYIKNNL